MAVTPWEHHNPAVMKGVMSAADIRRSVACRYLGFQNRDRDDGLSWQFATGCDIVSPSFMTITGQTGPWEPGIEHSKTTLGRA